jgi:26S proteasome regulatory subunit N4
METTKLAILRKQKEEIEREIEEHGSTLREEVNIGMSGNLVDSEGYPRADIDIYKVRLARQRINVLQNDYNKLLEDIDKELGDYHLKLKHKESLALNEPVKLHLSFLKVTQIDQESPAQEAGLQLNDEIIQFGPYVEDTVDKKLTKIAELVKSNENKIILLNVSRFNDETKLRENLKIKLIPKKWCGHGLLGCKIVPIEKKD